MNIILIRHAESTANVEREIYKKQLHHDIPITELGEQQSKQASYELEKHVSKYMRSNIKEETKIKRIQFIVSPYLRAKQTLDCMLESGLTFIQSNFDIRYEPLVCEHIVGSNLQQIQKLNMDYNKFNNLWYCANGAESYAQVYTRAKVLLTDLKIDYARTNKTIVIVAHGGFLAMLEGILRDTNPEESTTLYRLKNCEIRLFENLYL